MKTRRVLVFVCVAATVTVAVVIALVQVLRNSAEKDARIGRLAVRSTRYDEFCATEYNMLMRTADLLVGSAADKTEGAYDFAQLLLRSEASEREVGMCIDTGSAGGAWDQIDQYGRAEKCKDAGDTACMRDVAKHAADVIRDINVANAPAGFYSRPPAWKPSAP